VWRRGTPVRLVFDRRETSPCSEEVVLPDFGMKHYLPAHRPIVVEFTPTEAGTFGFSCGMNMLRGRITVTPGKER
jgi:Cu+-exporting ATPase